ncbi:MAG: hypothetical protein EOO65_00580 [Methanosarcinales archaeon]|nr:MAG: hypothetical protein EOO65_00580 [Methanosarcinales archaeon]
MNRSHIDCTKTETIAEEIISGKYVEVLRKLGAQVQVIDMIPDTPYTVMPGGRHMFWGMAFNKLRVFELTQFRKVIWLDGDVMVQKNIDHLMREPMFTAAITYDCCNGKYVLSAALHTLRVAAVEGLHFEHALSNFSSCLCSRLQ